MPNYTKEGEEIEGQRVFCTFEKRPSHGIDKQTGRQQTAITGNPATACITQVWKYQGN
jgi:hypothetical protein